MVMCRNIYGDEVSVDGGTANAYKHAIWSVL